MTAATLEEAIELQNASPYGLTAGIHSLDPREVEEWTDTVQAGNLYVNRGITGAIVQRQPFGGWKRSSVGTGAKAGGPNYLYTLGTWTAVDPAESEDLRLDELSDAVASIVKKAQAGMSFAEFSWVRSAALSDEAAWMQEFGSSRDVSALGVERNVFRYKPVPVTIRLSEGQPMGELVRLVAAATRAKAPIAISSALPISAALMAAFTAPLAPVKVLSVKVETDEHFLSSGVTTSRVRIAGPGAFALAEALDGDPDVAIYSGDVTVAGRVELLPFVHEQAVSVTAHRFGNPDPAMEALAL
jgi:RHH-type proline utilization regulon transcriptional repressor/proline dehydrogenase/delta 1-pyrroline-5-carboxylate dehydrogenase